MISNQKPVGLLVRLIGQAETSYELDDLAKEALPSFTNQYSTSRIEIAIKIRGALLRDRHQLGYCVPRYVARSRRFYVAYKSMMCKRSLNGYDLVEAHQFVIDKLSKLGIPGPTIEAVWQGWRPFPHRALMALDDMMAEQKPAIIFSNQNNYTQQQIDNHLHQPVLLYP